MVDSVSDSQQHAARLRHHLNRVSQHRAQIVQDAKDAAAAHYAQTNSKNAPSDSQGPTRGAPHDQR